MVNQCKLRDDRFLKRWKDAGALATIVEAFVDRYPPEPCPEFHAELPEKSPYRVNVPLFMEEAERYAQVRAVVGKMLHTKRNNWASLLRKHYEALLHA